MKSESLKICFLGGQHVGLIGFLTALSLGHNIRAAVGYSDELKRVLKERGVNVFNSIREQEFKRCVEESDVILSVHGREIVSDVLLGLPRLGALNVHPYLYCYKGANPIQRALNEQNSRASVGMHFMTSEIDGGDVLVEEFLLLSNLGSVGEIYSQLYSVYHDVIVKGLFELGKRG